MMSRFEGRPYGRRTVPALFLSLQQYRSEWLTADLVAGLTVWAVLVPEALAYASIAGVSPVVGLYAAPGALILYAALGSSRYLVTGPMAATAALSAAAVADLTTGGADEVAAFTVALALCTGLAALIAGIARLGFVANFIAEPVLKGFIIGLSLTIIVGQLPKLFGVEKAEGNVFVILWHLAGDLGDTSGWTLFVGVLSLAVVLSLRRWAPRVPASLVAVIVGIVLVAVFDLDDDGVAIVGHVDSGLPTFGLPGSLALDDYLAAVAAAIGIMLVGFAEGLGAAKTYAAKRHEEVDTNRELLGLGAANVAAALSSGMVVNGSLSKTAVNASGGARSQLSGLFVAAMTVVTLLFLTGLFEDLPEATLAAVVICALVELVDVDALRRLWRLRSRRFGRLYGPAARADFIAAFAAMAGVLVFDTLPGLVIGIATSFVLLVYRSSSPHIAELGRQQDVPGRYADLIRHPEDPTVPGLVILRPEAGLFFANAEAVRDAVVEAADRDGVRAVVVDAESVPFIDVTALGVLVELGDVLDESGVVLAVAHGIGQVTDLIDKGADEAHLQLFPTVEAAVTALRPG